MYHSLYEPKQLRVIWLFKLPLISSSQSFESFPSFVSPTFYFILQEKRFTNVQKPLSLKVFFLTPDFPAPYNEKRRQEQLLHGLHKRIIEMLSFPGSRRRTRLPVSVPYLQFFWSVQYHIQLLYHHNPCW